MLSPWYRRLMNDPTDDSEFVEKLRTLWCCTVAVELADEHELPKGSSMAVNEEGEAFADT